MAGDAFTQLLLEFEAERPTLQLLSEWLAAHLSETMRARRIPAQVSCRVKEVHSLVLKGYQRNRTDLPDFRDRLAGRIATYYTDDRLRAVDALVASLNCPDGPKHGGASEEGLGDSLMGYDGIHCDLLIEPTSIPLDLSAVAKPLWCEVQVHTMASSLWAATSHPLGYKSAVAPRESVRRALSRLSVLTEIYDAELIALRDDIRKMPSYPVGRVLQILEAFYFQLFGEIDHDRETSELLVGKLLPSLGSDDVEQLETLLSDLFETHEANLRFIYRDNDPAAQQIPLLMQPEALLFFERLVHNQPKLQATWVAAELPQQWYDDLSDVWGG